MKKTTLFIAIILSPFFLFAQNDQTPRKYENAEWYWVIYLKFEVGKTAEAYDIIKKYWRPIESNIGTEQNVYEFETGEWDLIRMVKMPDGISSMEWELSPMGVKYNNEFLKIAGSEEKVTEVREHWSECLEEFRVEIARKFNPL